MWQVSPHNPSRHSRHVTQALGIIFFGWLVFYAVPSLYADPTLAPITGTVFRDFNNNNTRETREPGIANVTVTGTDQAGATATTTTASNGTYTLSGLTGMVRVEFTLPTDNSLNYLQPGAAGGSLVQFVDATSATSANAGFFNPSDFTGTNPRLATTIFRRADNTGSTESVLDDYPYSANGLFGAIGTHQVMSANTGGTLYGLAYQRTMDRLYSGAYIRRGASLGSTDSTGAIYRTTTPTGTPGTALLLNVNGLTYNSGANTINTGTNPHPKATTSNWVVDSNAYAATGKVGLGDLEIADDDLTLYAVNLNQRAVIVLPFNSDKITINTGAVTQVTVPSQTNCGSTIGQVRPFGLKFHDGHLYVGAVCTAEGSSGTTSNLRAYVFRFDPDSNTFTTMPILEFALTYPRRHINDNFGSTAGNTADGEWRPWSDTWRPAGCYGCSGELWAWPQPVLTDIEFDGEGFMMLGFRDRLADQTYYEQDPGPSNGTLNRTRNGGDLLLACLAGSTWTLESAGVCNGRTTGDTNSTTSTGINYGSGPANREFYYQDNYSLDFTPDYHRDTELGSLAVIKGSGEIVSTFYDTFATFEGGTVTLNNLTGARVRGAQLYPEGASFGKAGGIGDVELLAAPAPIEIGNRLWRDSNGNGIQDPGESGLAGVTVQLYTTGGTPTLVGTVVSDLNGNYLFSSDTNRTDVLGADYGITQMIAAAALQIRVVPTAGQNANALNGLVLTAVDADGSTNGDVRDSDATLSGGTAIINVTLGEVGHNNHTYDIGYTTLGAIGNRVWLDEDSNGYQDEGEAGISNVTVQLKNAAGTVIATTVTDSNGNYIFKNLPTTTYFVQVLGSTVTSGLTQTTIYPNASADETNQNQSTGNGYQIVLGVGQDNLTADFGYNWNPTNDVNGNVNTATLGDCVWIDADGDGAQDPNEAGIAAVTVSLITAGPDNIFGTSDDVTTTTTTTSATGCYIFDGLTPGAYIVRVNPPSGYTQTGDPDHWGTTGTNDNQTTVPVILGPGDVFLDADFGYQPNAGTFGSIGNTVWFDTDSDGCGPNPGNGDGSSGNCTTPDATESFIANVTVVLIRDSNNNGTWDAGEPIIATDVTDASGQYLFPGLPIADGAGTDDYLVYVNDIYNALRGLTPTYDQNGIATPNISRAADLTATPVTNQDFGYNTDNSGQSGVATTLQILPAGTDLAGGVGDRVWLDLDGDGVQDAGEPGIAGVQVNLICNGLDGTLNTSDDIRETTFTNANGTYYFTDLPVNAGGNSCTITVVTSTLPGTLTQTYDANGTGTPNTSTISLTIATPVNTLQDFGYRGTGTIGNFVWRDTNADGDFDGLTGPDGIAGNDDDEIALAGVTITLWYDRNTNGRIDTGDTAINTLTTDAGGAYLFTGLSTANTAYIVDVTDAAGVLNGYWHSLGTANTNNNSQVDPLAVTLTAAAPNSLNADFGYYIRGAALGNRVWNDDNGNGLQDTGEPGISGVVVSLLITYPGGTTTTLNTVTNSAGYYSFANLLLDEDYNGTGTTPTHSIRINTAQTNLSGYGLTTVDVGANANDLRDSDAYAGVNAAATKGLTTIPLTAMDPVTEPTRASYDFGFVSTLDYGDLPTTYSNIQLLNDGARHVIGTIRLGTLVDSDGDGTPTATANGDDTLDGNDDEDGVIKTPGSIWQAGGNGSLNIQVSGGTGFVSAWIDWNRDNDFADAGERIFVDRSITNSTQTVTFPIPAGTTFPAGTVLNLRVRLYSTSTSGTASPVGLAVGTGEVEDHQLASAPLGVVLDSFGAQCRPTEVLASWITVSETDVLGFNLLRGTTDAEPDLQLNSELIASQAPGGGQGASYEFADTTVTDGTHYYWLESVSMSGQTERFGPVNATFPCEATAVTVGGFDATPATTLSWNAFAIGALLLAGVVLARRR